MLAKSGKIHRIMVVDDEADELDLYKRFLRAPDYEVVTMDSSADAIALLRRECWDILISDIYMPVHDGFEVMREGQVNNPEIRCIAVTGYGTDNVLEKVLDHDCFGYVNKPFDWDYLKLLVAKAIKAGLTPKRSQSSQRKNKI